MMRTGSEWTAAFAAALTRTYVEPIDDDDDDDAILAPSSPQPRKKRVTLETVSKEVCLRYIGELKWENQTLVQKTQELRELNARFFAESRALYERIGNLQMELQREQAMRYRATRDKSGAKRQRQ